MGSQLPVAVCVVHDENNVRPIAAATALKVFFIEPRFVVFIVIIVSKKIMNKICGVNMRHDQGGTQAINHKTNMFVFMICSCYLHETDS